jgi:DNA polymerase zeta
VKAHFIVDAYIQRLHKSIDHSMAVAYRRNPHDPRNNTYVARITLCKGVPFYGFHVGWKFYLKIYMLNPACMQRLADLLRNGSIMSRKMQPYEVHIPYLLQFMADYGLYGCGWVECQTVTFRAPVPSDTGSPAGQTAPWDESTIPEHLITSTDDKPRLSHCSIEIDLLSHHILNRRTIKPRLLHHDFIERKHPISLDEKLVHSMAELWQDEERRRAQKGDTQPAPSMYTSLPRHDEKASGKGPWIHEEELRSKLDEVILAERSRGDGHALNFDTFVKPAKFQSLVQTTIESVSAMFPAELPSSSQTKENYVGLNVSSGHVREDNENFPSADVNEAGISADLENMDGASWDDSNNVDQEYFSEQSSESPSEFDFDDDLLGRGPDGSTLNTGGGVLDLGRDELSAIDQMADFSDDLELDFDISSPTITRTLSYVHERGGLVDDGTIVGNRGHVASNQNNVDSNGNMEPLRLRGGASTPEPQKRKLETPTSIYSSKRPRTLEVVESGSGHVYPSHIPSAALQSSISSGGAPNTPSISKGDSKRKSQNRKRAPLELSMHPRSSIVESFTEQEIPTIGAAIQSVSPSPNTPSSSSSLKVGTVLPGPQSVAGQAFANPTRDILHTIVHSPSIASSSSYVSARENEATILHRKSQIRRVASEERLKTHVTLGPPLSRLYFWDRPSPTPEEVLSELPRLGIPRVMPRSAYYSKDEDVPTSTREYGGRDFKLVSDSLPYLTSFNSQANFTNSIVRDLQSSIFDTNPSTKLWQIERRPPLNMKLEAIPNAEGSGSGIGAQSGNMHWRFSC